MKWLKKGKKAELEPSLQQQRTEKLAQMGAELAKLRQQQGLSLLDVVILTKIPERLLQAIEAGNLKELPEPVYIQALVRQFADALGLNAEEFVKDFPIEFEQLCLKPIFKDFPVRPLRPIHLYFLYIGVIFSSVSGLSQFLNQNSLPANNIQTQPSLQTQEIVQPQENMQQPPVAVSLSSVDTQQQRQSSPESEEVQVGLTLQEKSWIRVVADGKIAYEGELPEGTQRTWKAQEELKVKAGNAGGVLVSVNHQEAKQMGESGQVEEMRIAAKPRS
ncbi:MAG: DUF4115 domain-containing protein [Nostocaceae cyanobacterium]|nr:DUF4115 domain-containing protein [Nostocaceae cyanobacterium]